MKVNIDVVFKGGKGNLTATVVRDGDNVGLPISISQSDTIEFDDVAIDDIIELRGVSPTDGTNVTIEATTLPATPRTYREGAIFTNYEITATGHEN